MTQTLRKGLTFRFLVCLPVSVVCAKNFEDARIECYYRTPAALQALVHTGRREPWSVSEGTRDDLERSKLICAWIMHVERGVCGGRRMLGKDKIVYAEVKKE